MPDRFGGSTDYSAQFGYLAQTYLNDLEQQAEKADARRESEQAAKDTEAFARYDAGKMSGDELLAYIRRRIAQTGYDPKQQAEWKKALLQYTESINDGKALTAFEKSNDYNGYIEYLRGKMSSANPQKRAELQSQINSLIDQRDQQSVTRGAERILLQIAKGKASYTDLLAFYKTQLKNTRQGSSVRTQIREQISSVTQQVRNINLTNRKGQLDQLLASNTITPQEYGQRLKDLARSSGLQQTSPDTYNSWMQTAEQSIRTVLDMGRLEEIDGKLARGEITPKEAETLYYLEAERYKVVDPKTYQQIRNAGYKVGITPVPGFTPLPNPEVLGLSGNQQQGPGPLTGTLNAVQASKNIIFKWITQLDGSEYGQVNCVYASAAMLAYAMGYREKNGYLSGGDLRYLSGDRTIGTNLDEAQAALGKLGITGLKNWNDKHISFEQFKLRVGQRGMPAVLMGINNNLPDNLKAFAGAAKGHGVFVAAYDPKKKAFLWYDPAVSKNQNPNYKGIWVSEDVVRNFGWGPSYSDSTGSWSFSGQALFAPPHTIKGTFSANNVQRPDIHYVNVDDAPVRPETPKRYRGYNHRGPSTVEPVGNEAVDKKGRARAAAGGKWNDNTPDTVEEVQQALAESRKRRELIDKLGTAYSQGKDRVTVGTTEYVLNEMLMKQLDQETLDTFDRDVLYAEAAGLESDQTALYNERTAFLAGVKARNSVKSDVIINTAIRDARKDFEIALKDPDPSAALKSMQVIKARLQILNGVQQAGNTTDTPLDDLSTDGKYDGQQVARTPADLNAIISLLDQVTTPNPGTPISERLPDILNALQALGEEPDQKDSDGNIRSYGSDLGNLVMQMVDQRNAQDLIDAGTHIAVTNGQTGGTTVVPLVPKYNPQTGAEDMVPFFGADDNGQPVQGIQVPVQTPTGVEMRWVIPGVTETGFTTLRVAKSFTLNGATYEAGSYLSEAQISKLVEQGALQQGIASGQLAESPYRLVTVKMPDRKVNGKTIPGTTFYQDESGGWFTGGIPVTSFGAYGGKYIGSNPDMTPQFQYRPFATSAMYPLPYQGDRAAIQKASDDGTISLPPVATRGFDGNLTPDLVPEAQPRFASLFDPTSPRNQLGMPSTNVPSESEIDRTERILEAVQAAVNMKNQRNIYNNGQGADGGTFLPPTSIPLPVNDRSGIQTGLPSQTASMPTGVPGFGPQSQVQPQNGFGPQGPGGADLSSLSDLAGSLGVKTGPKGGLFGPQGQAPQQPKGDLFGPQGQFVPPTPKQTRLPGQKKESSLPKIGTSVMVGGTQIDLPDARVKAPPRQTFTPPPPPKMGTGSAASASLAMLGGKKETRVTSSGRSES